MRIVAGSAKGKKLLSVPGDTTRPILDRVRTSLFDILRPEIEGIKILDLFAGSGSVGIEALSQGAAHCTFLDLEKKAIEVINKNLEATNLTAKASVHHQDAFKFLKRTEENYDLIYVAPPQYKGLWEEAMRSIAERPSLVKAGGKIIVQIDPKEYEELKLTHFKASSERKYGNTLLIFFEKV
ncbi:MAG: 16S rRNA (guanine(966)-N(2))-methyltransferase RsmD [Deltaproteobacteria bacterium]|nr:16S rRNA (guanine(966)-N(2))-methyltransferase RsmD [Deltaproteobacteria bacterium]